MYRVSAPSIPRLSLPVQHKEIEGTEKCRLIHVSYDPKKAIGETVYVYNQKKGTFTLVPFKDLKKFALGQLERVLVFTDNGDLALFKTNEIRETAKRYLRSTNSAIELVDLKIRSDKI